MHGNENYATSRNDTTVREILPMIISRVYNKIIRYTLFTYIHALCLYNYHRIPLSYPIRKSRYADLRS